MMVRGVCEGERESERWRGSGMFGQSISALFDQNSLIIGRGRDRPVFSQGHNWARIPMPPRTMEQGHLPAGLVCTTLLLPALTNTHVNGFFSSAHLI